MGKIVILTLYPEGIAPGPRFRYEQYLHFLKEKFDVQLLSFFSLATYRKLHANSSLVLLAWSLLIGYIKTCAHLISCLDAEYVFIFRDVTPFGPPVFEWIIAKIFRKKIIYDFDDAIWLADGNQHNKLRIWLRNPGKTDKIIAWSYKVSAGNEYLGEHARLYNQRVTLNPTTIDTDLLHNEIKDQDTDKVVVGWTGTHSTLKYLEPILPIIAELENDFDFEFLVICNKNPNYALKSYRFLQWNKSTEKEDLLKMNFGLMPLEEDEWSKGKCGFKALQYMSLGMPAIVSPVGVNAEIVTHGINGLICSNDAEWKDSIRQLLQRADWRKQMGLNARETVIKHYSVKSNKNNFMSLFTK